MSTIKVNTITPRTCNSIQLGESGDTLTIPSGATLQNCGTATGFGISFCSTVKTSPFTATAGKGFFINTGSAVTVTLPASPSTGDELIVIDSTGNASSNNITLGRNGSKIKGQCIDAKINVDRGGVRIVYSGSSQGWVTATAANDATASQIQYVTATGGTVTTCGDFKIHTFTSSDNFVVSCAGNACGSNKVDYLVVAGGGAGGRDTGGGGGAGGLRIGAVTVPGPSSPLVAPGGLAVPAQTYPITIGAGGAINCSPCAAAGSGANSVFSSITSAGGGGAGGQGNTGTAAASGGSGGGAGGSGAVGSGNTPPVSPPQGNDGGAKTSGTAGGGGGGGATAAGSVGGASCRGGPGGSGLDVSPIFGSAPQPFYQTNVPTAGPTACGSFAGGGGGGPRGPAFAPGHVSSGAAGGGGDGRQNGPESGFEGVANSGGGGGAGPGGASPQVGTTGGSGIVVIRYKFQN